MDHGRQDDASIQSVFVLATREGTSKIEGPPGSAAVSKRHSSS